MERHPFIFSDQWKYRLRRHAAFWAFWWLFQAFLYSFIPAANYTDYLEALEISMFESLVFMLNHIVLSYALMYFVIPRYLLKQRYWATAVCTGILFIGTGFFSAFLGHYIINPIRIYIATHGYLRNYFDRAPRVFFRSLLAGMRGGITVAGIAAAIKLMKFWYVKEQRNLQLQKENIASQLQLLKAQVHPHFLFNTLNNIYSYTQNTSPVAAQLITGLSDILRFVLYESNQVLVPLSKEIKMMQDYIRLEEIRYGNKLDLHTALPEETSELYIAPLLMLPLIENAFKHGASNILDQPWISLTITIRGSHMQLKLLNAKTDKERTGTEPAGIGIENVKKRLELIYPGKHELVINNEEDVFIVNLKIELIRIMDPAVKPVNPEPAAYV